MARPTGLIAAGEMKRIRNCATENENLARCWQKSHVALVTMEWAPSCLAYSWRGWIARNEVMGYWSKQEAMPVLSVGVTAPGSAAISASEDQCNNKGAATYGYRFWLRRKWPESVVRMREEAWQASAPSSTQSRFVSIKKAATVLEKLFQELASTHSAICVCSHRPSLTQRGLAGIGFKLPKGTLFVDMIKVLEYQSRFRDIPPGLKGYIDSCLDVDKRNGIRFEEKLEANDGEALESDFNKHAPKYGQDNEWREIIRKREDLSAGTMLKILGPEAEVYRRQITQIEKDQLALERVMKHLGSEGAKDINRRVKREMEKERAVSN
jgi:hypothetical protein